MCRWGVGTFDATPAANDDELDLVPGAASVDHDAFALGSNPRGGGGLQPWQASGLAPWAHHEEPSQAHVEHHDSHAAAG